MTNVASQATCSECILFSEVHSQHEMCGCSQQLEDLWGRSRLGKVGQPKASIRAHWRGQQRPVKTALRVSARRRAVRLLERPSRQGCQLHGRSSLLALVPHKRERYAIDPSKLENALGWRAAETFETGLAKTRAVVSGKSLISSLEKDR
jgi:hypothetical protein